MPPATDEIETTLTERCLYAKLYSRGRYCSHQGPCAFRGAWIILNGDEQQKCDKRPLQFAEWSTVGLYVWPAGVVTIEKTHDAQQEIIRMIGSGKKAIVVDLTNVTELHVNLLETLADLRGELLKAHPDGTMTVISLEPTLRYAFDASHLVEGIQVMP